MLFRDKHEKEAIFWSMYLFHIDFFETSIQEMAIVLVYVIDFMLYK